MEMGRRNGISLIHIFQGSHQTKPKQYSLMNQSDIRLIFRLTDYDDAEQIAKSNGLKPPGKFIEKIRRFVIGNLEDHNEELYNNRFIEIAIPNINM